MKKTATLALLTLFSALLIQAQQREWTILATYTIPGQASGLTWDGTHLYSGLYSAPGDDNIVYQIDPNTGAYSQYLVAPYEKCYGLSYDGTHFWGTDRTGAYTPAIAVEFDHSGNLLSQFDLPATYHSGIEYDDGNFWTNCYYDPDGMVYELDGSGTILSQFSTPSNQPWAICKEGDNLWIADYDADMLYKVDQSGNLLESHASESVQPTGVVWDGQFLWYCDGPSNVPSTLYKIDLYGAGTPSINIPDDHHDYGVVTVNQSVIWQMAIQNNGTTDLVINNIFIANGVPIFTTFTPPQTIAPGNSINVPLTYNPDERGPLNTTISILSNDPVNPTEHVSLSGHAVEDGPYLVGSASLHDYGDVRIKATTRWFFYAKNYGDEPLQLTEINLGDPHFSLDEGLELPVTIATLDSVGVGFWFQPFVDTDYSDEVSILNNDPGHTPFLVSLEGSGLDQEWPIGEPLWYYEINADYDNSPKAIASIDDVTGDKVEDVIVCSEDDRVRCVNGNSHNKADIIWELEIPGGSVQGQNGLTIIEDIDGDFTQDVIVGNAWGDRAINAISGMSGEIIWKHDTHEYGDGGWVYQVDARYDYNGDDIPDVLAATGNDGGNTGPRRIYCLDGLTGESIWETMTGGPNFSVIGVEDFTGDGLPDVMAGAANADESQGKVFGLDGVDGSTEWIVSTDGTSVWALEQLGDINQDNVPDVIAGDFGGHVYLIDPTSGGIITNTSVGGVLILRFVQLDDVNGDTYPDILIAHSGSNGIVISGLDGSNIWLKPLQDKSWVVARSNDLTGDAINDVLIGTLFSDNYCYFMDGTDGDELESIHYTQPLDAINAIPDIVGDGSYEMVAGGREGRVSCYSGGIHSIVGIDDAPIVDVLNNSPVQTYPNPASDISTITFNLEKDSFLELNIYGAGGKNITQVYSGQMTEGNHKMSWDGRDASGKMVPSGIYFFRLNFGEQQQHGRIIRVNNR